MKLEETHLTAQEVEQYRRRALDPELRRRCDRHMASCDRCLEQVLGGEHSHVASDRLWESFTDSGEAPFHLSGDDLQRYISAEADEADKAIFEVHVEDCPACRSAYEGLLASKGSPIAVPVRPRAGGEESAWERFKQSWIVFVTPGRLAWGSALAACLLVSLVAWRYYRLGGNASQGGRASNPTNTTHVVARLHNGSAEVTIDEKGNVVGLGKLAPQAHAIVEQALTTAQLPKPEVLSQLAESGDKLMGSTAKRPAFSLVSPLGAVIAESQPTLGWEPLTGAKGYVVSVSDTQFRNVAKSPRLATTEWRLPVPLQRGNTYFWQVTALRGQQQITVPVAPAPRAQFKVLDQKTMDSLEAVKAQQPDSHLVLGVLYAHAGLLHDAEREFQALVKQNPDSLTAIRLLRCVQEWESGKSSSK